MSEFRELIGDSTEFEEVESALVMPVLESTPAALPVGIHFGLDEQLYHAIPAFGKTHLVNFLCSPTQWWGNSWLNPERKEKDADHLIRGKAYHCAILEGHEAYTSRFYPLPDKRDYPNALSTVEEIKSELERQHQTPIVKVDKEGGKPGQMRAAAKRDWIEQLVSYDRSTEVWDAIVAKTQRIAGDRTMISADDDRRIRVAAKMIALDAQLGKAFTGGYPEVTLCWHDPRTGVLCKARIDYLKLRAVIDLKSFANRQDRSVRNAILNAIASHYYALQPAVYLEGIDEVRKLVRKHGVSVIFNHDSPSDGVSEERQAFTFKWAANDVPDRFLFCFQQTGEAPVTRAMWWPVGGSVHAIAQSVWRDGLRGFRKLAEAFGNGQWLDLSDIEELSDEDIPSWGLMP